MPVARLTHLSIFASQDRSGTPAEVAVTATHEPPVQINERLREPTRAALDPADRPLEGAVLETLSAVLTPASQDELRQDPDRAIGFVRRVIERAVEANDDGPPNGHRSLVVLAAAKEPYKPGRERSCLDCSEESGGPPRRRPPATRTVTVPTWRA